MDLQRPTLSTPSSVCAGCILLTSTDAVNLASFKDTIKLVEGTYTGTGNYNINLGGKAITIISVCYVVTLPLITLGTQRTRTYNYRLWRCKCFWIYYVKWYHLFNHHANSEGESWDTTIQAITVQNCKNGAFILNPGSPTIRDCLFVNNSRNLQGSLQ